MLWDQVYYSDEKNKIRNDKLASKRIFVSGKPKKQLNGFNPFFRKRVVMTELLLQLLLIKCLVKMYNIILGFITAFTITYFVIPAIIQVARERRLFDAPNERSVHKIPTPALGGIAIFAGAVCGVVLWTPLESFGVLQYILAGFIMIFLIGVMDDLMPISPNKKFLGQIMVAVVLAYKADVRITGFYGLFGIEAIPELVSFLFSVIVIVGIINAFNLIDGINGLAGSIGLLTCITWGSWFMAVNESALSVVAFSLAGAIIAFLRYNLTPAQIFMGDTGSLLIGTVSAILAIRFIELNQQSPNAPELRLDSAPAIAIGVLILPLYDTMRVFIRRIVQGRSPFYPDKTHIHHIMLELGHSHMQATGLLVSANAAFILTALLLHHLGTVSLLIIELAMAFFITEWLYRRARHRHKPL